MSTVDLERVAEYELVDRFKGAWRDPVRDSVAGFDADGNSCAYAWTEYRSVTEGTHSPTLFGEVPAGVRIEPYSTPRDEDVRVAHNESFARDHWGSSPIDPEAWTDLVSVRREWRGRGLAGALLTAAMRAYAAGGMEYAGLDADTDNPTGALGVYTRLGYARLQGSVLQTKEI